MYSNPYYNPQPSIDRINSQISELERIKSQLTQPSQPSINQTFQLSPSQGFKQLDSLEQVHKEMVFVDTPFFSKDMTVLWLKRPSGEVKTYELNEIVEKDEKDLRIEFLMAQIDELKKGADYGIADVVESDKSKKSSSVSKSRKNDK